MKPPFLREAFPDLPPSPYVNWIANYTLAIHTRAKPRMSAFWLPGSVSLHQIWSDVTKPKSSSNSYNPAKYIAKLGDSEAAALPVSEDHGHWVPSSLPCTRFLTRAKTVPFAGAWACSMASSKESTCNAGDAGDMGSIPGSGRLGNPCQYSCLENRHGQRSLVDYSP